MDVGGEAGDGSPGDVGRDGAPSDSSQGDGGSSDSRVDGGPGDATEADGAAMVDGTSPDGVAPDTAVVGDSPPAGDTSAPMDTAAPLDGSTPDTALPSDTGAPLDAGRDLGPDLAVDTRPDTAAPMDTAAPPDTAAPRDTAAPPDTATPPDTTPPSDTAVRDSGAPDTAPVDTGTGGCTGGAPVVTVTAPAASAVLETCSESGRAVFFEFTATASGGSPIRAVQFNWRTPDGALAPPPPPPMTAPPYRFLRQLGGAMGDMVPLAVLGLRGTWGFEVTATDSCGRTTRTSQPFTLIYTTRRCPNP